MTIKRSMYQRLQALILILMAIFFAQKFVSGDLYLYIGPRFGWLALVAVALLIVMASAYNLVQEDEPSGEHHHHHHVVQERVSVWPLMIIALPLLLGVIVPARPLGASAVSNRGITSQLGVAPEEAASTLTIVSSERNVLDWVRAINAEGDPANLTGQEADILGFVYHDQRFSDDQFMVGRFTLTCCVADALAIGVVVRHADARTLPSDSWVRVRGRFAVGMVAGEEVPVLVAEEMIPVQQPEQPYLYP